jgi:hypothetical protein
MLSQANPLMETLNLSYPSSKPCPMKKDPAMDGPKFANSSKPLKIKSFRSKCKYQKLLSISPFTSNNFYINITIKPTNLSK